MTARPTRIAILLSYSGDGGVERMINHLIAGLLAAGHPVDVLVLKTRGGHFRDLPVDARVVRLGTEHAAFALPALVRYLRRERPPVLLAAKDRAARLALHARRVARVPTRVVLRLGNTLSRSLARHGPVKRWLRLGPIRRLYPHADALIAVSRGVADDIVDLAPVDPARVHVVANPVVTPALYRQAQTCPDHAWLGRPGQPVVLAVGRLAPQKDFPTLLRAFAELRAQGTDARLIILGEGEERQRLTTLAAELGIADFVDLAGFRADAPAWLAAADLFVLSSAWEGSPNALTEALALGTPVVATDCPSGPSEILHGGEVAPLVAVGDAAAMARAMRDTLQHPPPSATLRAAVADHDRDRSTRAYLDILTADLPSTTDAAC